MHGLGLQVLAERRSAGVDLVEVEAARYIAGLVGGEGEAPGLASRTAIIGRGPGSSRLTLRLWWFRASRTLLSSLGMVGAPLGCSGSGGDGQWFAGADDLDRDVGGEAAGRFDEEGGVFVALEEEQVAHGAAGEGVVLRYR